MKDIKVKRSELVHVILFIVYSILYLTLLMNYGMGSEFSRWRYAVLLSAVLIGFVGIIKKHGLRFFKKTKHNELLLFVILGVLFFVGSIIICGTNSHALPSRVYVQIFLMASPAIYAYCILNLLNSNTVMKCLKFILYLSVILYLIESRDSAATFFSSIGRASLFEISPFGESAIFSEIFLQLFFFFNYFKNIKRDKSVDITKRDTIVSGVFAILCRKRLAVLTVFLSPIINAIVRKLQEKKPNLKLMCAVLVILFTIGTIIYTLMLQHKIFDSVDIYKLTTGRDYILSLWERYDYVSYGYGSSMLVIGRYLELDLVQVYLELGLINLIVFCAIYLNSARRSIYGIAIMSYCLLNMLTASSIPYAMGWIIAFLSIRLIEESSDDGKQIRKMKACKE